MMIFMETYNATIHNHQRTCRKVHSSAGKGCVSPCELPKKRKPHLEFHMEDFVAMGWFDISLPWIQILCYLSGRCIWISPWGLHTQLSSDGKAGSLQYTMFLTQDGPGF